MSIPFRRRPEQSTSPHERARHRAAERLDGPIDPAEEELLEAHLAACAACRAVADEYASQRLELRTYRNELPEPPRDLWARTAAAIEGERRGTRTGRSAMAGGRRLAVPVGALSGLLVIAVVVTAAFLGRPNTVINPPAGSPYTAEASHNASFVTRGFTPISVAANVDFVRLGDNGANLYQVEVKQVCPKEGEPDCAPIAEPSPVTVPLPSEATSIIKSPTDSALVVVTAQDTTSGGSVVLVPVPKPTPSQSPAATSSSAPPSSELATPSPSTAAPESAAPTAGTVAMIDGAVIDSTAAYSRSGKWFAFSGRPVDASRGSNIYVWREGTTKATRITDDDASVFAGWANDRVIGGRAVRDAATRDASAAPGDTAQGETFLVDPATGTRETILRRGIWRPSVDPTGKWAAYWNGNLKLDANGVDWRPADGSLVLGPWTPSEGPAQPSDAPSAAPETASPNPDASADSGASTGPAVSPSAEPTKPSGSAGLEPSPSAAEESAEPSNAVPSDATEVLRSGPIHDWDARWDETGTHLAVWIADSADPSVGHLSLYAVDPATGHFIHDPQAIHDTPALPGFSIGEGRLAYATPPGQDAKGSRVQVVAWTASGIGQSETLAADTTIIVIR